MTRLPLPLLVLALGLVTTLYPREARACSCVPPPPPAVAFERAGAVFVGEVRAVKPRGENQQEVTLVVERAFKGVNPGELGLITPSSSAACGRTFEVGKRYLVYAERIQGQLLDHLCSRTALVADAKHDLEALEALTHGQPPPAEPQPAVEVPEGQTAPPPPPPSGAEQPSDQPALEQAPADAPSPKPAAPAPAPADAPAGHCAAAEGAGGPLVMLLLLGLCLVPRARLRARARRRMYA